MLTLQQKCLCQSQLQIIDFYPLKRRQRDKKEKTKEDGDAKAKVTNFQRKGSNAMGTYSLKDNIKIHISISSCFPTDKLPPPSSHCPSSSLLSSPFCLSFFKHVKVCS